MICAYAAIGLVHVLVNRLSSRCRSRDPRRTCSVELHWQCWTRNSVCSGYYILAFDIRKSRHIL